MSDKKDPKSENKKEYIKPKITTEDVDSAGAQGAGGGGGGGGGKTCNGSTKGGRKESAPTCSVLLT